jgi:integrase
LAETERLIQTLRAPSQPSAELLAYRVPIPRHIDRQLLQGRPAAEVFEDPLFFGTPAEAIDLSELPPQAPTTPVCSDDLLDLGRRLKQPSQQTLLAWEQSLRRLTVFLGHDRLDLVERGDAQKFRDKMLEDLKVSTVKTRLNFLSGLFQLGVEEDLLSSNPFTGVGKRLRPEAKATHDLDLEQVRVTDRLALEKLSGDQVQLYQILRFTGMRLAEAAGLRAEDINLEQGLINVSPNELRPLKTRDSQRVVPIHPSLDLSFMAGRSGHLFPSLYNEKTKRWGSGLVWSRLIGCNPHQLRHNVVSMLRAAGISEVVIGRLVGHAVPGMTARYGSVPFDKLVEAVNTIT